MKPYYFHILCFLLIISCVFAFIVANCSKSGVPKIQSLVLNGENLEPLGRGSTSRALLSLNAKQDIYLVASLDGTIYSVESNSGKVLWAFSSGSSIYSSYQALAGDTSAKEDPSGLDGGTKAHLKHNYIDVGDDCNWVWKGPNNTAKMELPMTPEEFVSYAPYMLDEQVILGSMKTTVFVLDAKNGRRVFTHTLHESRPNVEVEDDVDFGNLVESTAVDWKPVELINVIRKDFFVQSTDPKSGDILWNLTSAEFSYAYHLRGPGTNEFGLEYKGDFKMPLLYQKGAIVARIPNHYGAIGLEYKGDSNVPLLYQKGAIAARIPNHYGAKDFFQMHGGEMVLRQGERALPGPTSNVNMPNEYKDPHYSSWWKANLSWTTILGSLGLIAIFLLRRLSRSNNLSEKKTAVSKRKKARRLGNNKNNANFEKNNKIILFEEKGKTNDLQFVEKNDNEPLLDLTKSINGVSAGRKIGKLFVSNIEIAKGSNGTVVLEGNYEGRPVAIKRLVKAHHDVAFKEIQNLIASDRHPNIVRWYGVEYDSDFVYLSLERCMCSLNELIEICSVSSQSSVFVEDQSANSINEYNVQLDSVQGIDKDIELWKTNGYPSPSLLKMMRDVVSGLAHLHELGIIHRDLKPQNVLILKQRSLSAKLSDMGISKRLIGDMSSLGHHATGSGSSGWQAPEQLLHGRQTRAVDLFSLGCVLFFCITGGKHPFGDRLERDINIVKNRIDLFMVEHIPEAVDLLSHLLDSDPELRPKALDVLHHPLFWNSEMRLSFLRDTSDRVELEDRETESDLLKALEAVSPVALGGKWDEKMETAFIANIGRYRRYKFDSTRDLLRVIRNKLNHYRELPKEIQDILGSVPEGFDGYFASRFPRFLIQVYKVMYKYCREEECFWKYFKGNLS